MLAYIIMTVACMGVTAHADTLDHTYYDRSYSFSVSRAPPVFSMYFP